MNTARCGMVHGTCGEGHGSIRRPGAEGGGGFFSSDPPSRPRLRRSHTHGGCVHVRQRSKVTPTGRRDRQHSSGRSTQPQHTLTAHGHSKPSLPTGAETGSTPRPQRRSRSHRRGKGEGAQMIHEKPCAIHVQSIVIPRLAMRRDLQKGLHSERLRITTITQDCTGSPSAGRVAGLPGQRALEPHVSQIPDLGVAVLRP